MQDSKHPKLIYVLSAGEGGDRMSFVGQAGLKETGTMNLPPNDPELQRIAAAKAKSDMSEASYPWRLEYVETAISFTGKTISLFTSTTVKRIIEKSGVMPVNSGGAASRNSWYDCSTDTVKNAIRAAKEGRGRLLEQEKIPWPVQLQKRGKAARKPKARGGRHAAADALDWDDAQAIIAALMNDYRYRDAMIVGIGCYMGLRISDSLKLRWRDLLGSDKLELEEQKTGKRRIIKLNPALVKLTRECHAELCIENDAGYIANGTQNGGQTHITRQRVNQIIHNIKTTYMPDKNLVFSSHTFRKTFGRRVYENECRKGRGETALMLLADVFGHSNTNITKRYLGIRKEEILSVYDIL